MNSQTMTAEQIEAINAACQMIMDATGCTSTEAISELTSMFEDMSDILSGEEMAAEEEYAMAGWY